ncbi:MAG: glutaredoxin family protein [Planctomycetes bacterium]|nr:glutaredoxin family protein [Planctomycetota bacterium]
MTLILYSRPGCHLCEELEFKLRPLLERLRARLSEPVELLNRDIDADENWLRLYGERIPVLTRGDEVLLEGRPHDAMIARAIAGLSRG